MNFYHVARTINKYFFLDTIAPHYVPTSIHRGFALKNRITPFCLQSIPEDIVVERDSKENFKALTVAAEVDYGSDFEVR